MNKREKIKLLIHVFSSILFLVTEMLDEFDSEEEEK